MERAKLANAKETERANSKSARAPLKKTGRKPKAEKLVCRYCGSDDLAPSFIKRSDRRCREVFQQALCFGVAGEQDKSQEVAPRAVTRDRSLMRSVPSSFCVTFAAQLARKVV